MTTRRKKQHPLGDSSSVHVRKVNAYAREAVVQATLARQQVAAGNCKKAVARLEDARLFEGVLRAHYSSVKEEKRGAGSALQEIAGAAEAKVREAAVIVRARCVRR